MFVYLAKMLNEEPFRNVTLYYTTKRLKGNMFL